MENEQEQIKITDYDINMLLGLYMYDQGTRQIDHLAKLISVPENEVEKVLNDYRGTPVYAEFYAEISRFINQNLGKQDTEVLSKCVGEATDLMHAFYVLSERKVSPTAILSEGHADKLLVSAYFREMFGESLSAISKGGQTETSGWKSLMAGTSLAQDYCDSMKAMQLYSEYQSRASAETADQEADFRQLVNKAYARVERAERNYEKTFDRPFVLPEVFQLGALYATGMEDELLAAIREKKADMLVIGQFADHLCGSSCRLNAGFTDPHEHISAKLADELTRTVWFEKLVGYDLSHIQPQLMTNAQFRLAHSYAEQIGKLAHEGTAVSVVGLSEDGNEIDVPVNPENVNRRVSELLDAVKERKMLTDVTEAFLKGNGNGLEEGFFESARFRRQYGEDLSLKAGTLEAADILVMEQYRKKLENQAAGLANVLALEPSVEKLDAYREYEVLNKRLDAVSARMEELYDGNVSEVSELKTTLNNGVQEERVVMLLYDEKSFRFLTVDAGSRLDAELHGYSVIDRYTTLKEARDFVRLADEKIGQSKSAALTADSMKNEYKVFRNIPGKDKSAYLSVGILSADLATKSEHPDLAAMRAIAFEYEQKVAFDRANPGVADVIKTDENRAEYQAKVEKDSGADQTMKTGNGRSV